MKTQTKSRIASAFALLFALAAFTLFADVTYYVDAKNGNDETGTGAEDSPKRSLAGVGALIAAQDPAQTLTTVYVLPGNYGEDEGTDTKMKYEATDKSGNYSFRFFRVAIEGLSKKRKVRFVSTGGKEVTHVVGKADQGAAAEKYGTGDDAIGGVCADDSSYAAFEGFTIRDCYAGTNSKNNMDRGGGAASVMLIDCVVSNCVAYRGGGLYNGTAYRCRFTANRALATTYGAATVSSSLSNCLVDRNVGSSPIAQPLEMVNCTIVDHDSSYRAFNYASSGFHTNYNCLVVGNVYNGTKNMEPEVTKRYDFKALVCGAKIAEYPEGTTDADCRFEVPVDGLFNSRETLDYRVMSGTDAVNAGRSEYVSVLKVPDWAGGDGNVYDFAGKPIDTTQERVQAGCYQEVIPGPPAVVIDASADDVEVEGGVIGENVIGDDPIIVKAKRAGTRPFLGFAVDGEIKAHETSLDLRDLGVKPGERKTLTVVYGTVWYVKQDGGDDGNSGAYPDAAKQTIKAAATNAVSGDVIKVYRGTYGESDGTMKHTKRISTATKEIRIPSRVVVNAGVTIEAVEGPEVTFIVGRADPDASTAYPTFGLGPNAVRCVVLEDDATIKGFTITGGHVDKAPEIDGDYQYDDNSDCGGILGRTMERCAVVDCVVSNNVADEGGFGMYCRFIRSVIVGNVGVNRPASRTCAFYGCFLDNNDNGSMEHVSVIDSCTIGSTCWNADHTKNDVSVLRYPTKGGSFRNSIVLAKTIVKNDKPEKYLYAVTNCVFRESVRSVLDNDGEHAAVGNCTFIADVAAAGLDEDFRPVPGRTIPEILDAVTPEYEAMTDASTLSSSDIAGVPRVLNGARDLGAYEGDWRPRYSSDIGRRATVTEASPDVVEQDGKVTIPGGSKIIFTLTNTARDVCDYALNVAIEGGVLVVSVDGEPVTFELTSDIRLSIPTGTHAVSVALDGEKSDLARIQSLRSQMGLIMLFR